MAIRVGLLCLFGCVGLLAAVPAVAQKSKDTVRVGLLDPIRVVDSAHQRYGH
jgi:hypothetical protein